MPPPHPAVKPKANLLIFGWRFFTGHHLDGRARTNATWFRPGTAPSHHVNWWSAKPRFHRMLWRWSLLVIPTALIVAYHFAPSVQMNLVLVIGGILIPYLVEKISTHFIRLLPSRHVVIIRENIHIDSLDPELDKIDIEDHTMRQMMDLDNTNELERAIPPDVPPKPRTRRST